MLVDTHAHLNFSAFKDDFEEVVKRCLEKDIWVVNVGTKYETSKKAVEIAQNHKTGVYAAVGLHPIHLETGLVKIKNDAAELPSLTHGASTEEIEVKTREEEFDYEKYKELAKSNKVVAIGETGLDYYWRPKTTKRKDLFKQKQKNLLLKQLELANELNLPVIFHCRMAHADILDVLKSKIKNQKSKIEGVIHCFTGNWEEAKRYLEMGLYLGFNGIIFKLNLDEVIKNTPLDKILIETDCPYLTPLNFPEKRNNPFGVKFVAEKIAKIKGLTFEEIAKRTTKNAIKLFRIGS